jgi:hypothetical protein
LCEAAIYIIYVDPQHDAFSLIMHGCYWSGQDCAFLIEWTWNSQLLVKKYRSQIYAYFFEKILLEVRDERTIFTGGSARNVYPWTSAQKIVRKNRSDTVIQAPFSLPESWVNGVERNLRYPTSCSVPCTTDCPSESRPTTATHAGRGDITKEDSKSKCPYRRSFLQNWSQFISKITEYITECRPVARKRRLNKHLYNSRCLVVAI